jgi:hypothetical protein
VLKYLARYMTGGPISDRRIVRHEHGHVTFRARKGTKTGGSDETEEVRLPGVEFVRRWAMHILPQGYTKTRRYGGYSNPHRQRYIAECRELLPGQSQLPGSESVGGTPEATRETPEETLSTNPTDTPADEEPWMHRCPKCESLLIESLLIESLLIESLLIESLLIESLLIESLLILTSRTDRPGWRTVMSGLHRPTWYDDG